MSDLLANVFDLGSLSPSLATLTGVASLGLVGFILGFALNHGSVCTVIATRELISENRSARFIALIESAGWAALVYTIFETSPTMPQGWSPMAQLVPAAILFGLGTYINGACVFGSVGHVGNGDVGFGLVFLGIFAVIYAESLLGWFPDRPPLNVDIAIGPLYLAMALLAVLALRLCVSLRVETNFTRLTLSMAAIGASFTVLAVFAPGFSITASIGSILSVPVTGAVISICMFLGSFASARLMKRRITLRWPSVKVIVRGILGGALMGLGALVIPGGNDALLMIGFPMGAWQAVLAYALFVATLATLIARFGSTAKSWSR